MAEMSNTVAFKYSEKAHTADILSVPTEIKLNRRSTFLVSICTLPR